VELKTPATPGSSAGDRRSTAISSRTRERFRLWLGVVAVSAGFGAAYVAVLGPIDEFDVTSGVLLRGAGYGAVIGGSLTAAQFFYVDGPAGVWLRRAPFLVSLVIRTAGAALIISVALIVCGFVFRRVVDLTLESWLRDVAFSFAAAFVILFVVQMHRIIGGRVLRNLILGRYSKPVREDRVFMFLDIADSTRMAQELGDLGVHALISQFFFDIDAVVVEHGGETHRYIGDEVVITWPLDEGIKDGRCVRCVFAIRDRIAAKAEAYRRKFGVVPAFRVGLHGGPVVAGECGDSKQEISYFGDTINTAARIESECKELDVPLLVSGDLLDRMRLPPGLRAEPRGTTRLRGRDRETSLFTLRRGEEYV
jgi:adenylate cyclase